MAVYSLPTTNREQTDIIKLVDDRQTDCDLPGTLGEKRPAHNYTRDFHVSIMLSVEDQYVMELRMVCVGGGPSDQCL